MSTEMERVRAGVERAGEAQGSAGFGQEGFLEGEMSEQTLET